MRSRDGFAEAFGVESEALAKEAFQRMDCQLDLRLEAMEGARDLVRSDYQVEYASLWGRLQPFRPPWWMVSCGIERKIAFGAKRSSHS